MIGVWVLIWPNQWWVKGKPLDAATFVIDLFFTRKEAEEELYRFANNNDLEVEGDDNDFWASDGNQWEDTGTTYAYLKYKELTAW